jgi:hypothetical protein
VRSASSGARVLFVCRLSAQRRGRAAGSASLRRSACGRLPCGARFRGLRHNSLRSLRSLRSNRCRKSEVEARCARWPRALRSSAPQRRCARCPAAPLRQPPRFAKTRTARAPCEHRRGSPETSCSVLTPSRGRVAGGAPLRRRGAQDSGPRAQRASTTDLRHRFERSEQSERSESCRRPRGRAPQGSRPAGSTAAVKQPPATRPRLGALGLRPPAAWRARSPPTRPRLGALGHRRPQLGALGLCGTPARGLARSTSARLVSRRGGTPPRSDNADESDHFFGSDFAS